MKWIYRICSLCLFLSPFGGGAFEFFDNHMPGEIIVPKVNNCVTVITDGQIEKEEWMGSKEIVLSAMDSVYLYVRQTDTHIFLAIKAPFRMIPWVDMYFDFGDKHILNVHSSAQLGERNLDDTSWNAQSPPFHFGNTDRWYANEQRFDRIKAQELIAADPNRNRITMLWETTFHYDGYEYIFSKSRFSKNKWKVFIEVQTAMPGYRKVVYPLQSGPKLSDSWVTFIF